MKLVIFGALAFLLVVCLCQAVELDDTVKDVNTVAVQRDILACPNNCNGNGDCNGNICSCRAGWGGSDCSIRVRALVPGQSSSSTANMWSWDYWSYDVPTGNRATLWVEVQQNENSEADCDVYIKQGTLPSHSNYDYRDISLDGHIRQNVTNPQGRYYIGIFAFRECAYTIKASQAQPCPNNCGGHGQCNAEGVCECIGSWTGPDCTQQIPTLQLNSPVDSSVGLRQWKMFRVNLPYTYSSLQFTLQQTGSGLTNPAVDLDLYVRRAVPPTIIHFDYANGTLHHTSSVSIADAAQGDWYVGVWGYACPQGQTCSFRLTASITDRCPNRCSMRGFCRGTSCACTAGYSGDYCETQTAQMQIGRIYSGYVESFAWNYFTFRALSSNPIRVTVAPGTIHDGDCDLYIRKDSRPTIFQYDYKDNSGNSSITLDINNPGDSLWNIGMYGYRRCDYTIGITSITDSNQCRNGGVPSGAEGTCICPAGWGGETCTVPVRRYDPLVPSVSGNVRKGQFVYYNYSIPETPSDFVVYLRETSVNSRGQVWLFVNQQFVPTIRDHAFEDVDTNTQYHMITIRRDQLPQRRTGAQSFIIGVYGSPYIVTDVAPGPGYQLAAWASPYRN